MTNVTIGEFIFWSGFESYGVAPVFVEVVAREEKLIIARSNRI